MSKILQRHELPLSNRIYPLDEFASIQARLAPLAELASHDMWEDRAEDDRTFVADDIARAVWDLYLGPVHRSGEPADISPGGAKG